MVIKEWKCLAHGAFEAAEPAVCPHGCTTVERAFFTAPAIKSARTKSTDKNFRQIAMDFGLSDMNNDGGRGPARVLTRQQKQQQVDAEKLRVRFGALAKGGTYHTGERRQIGGTANGGAIAAAAALGAPQVNVLNDVKPGLAALKRPTIVTRDPDTASRAKVMAA